MIKIIRLNGSAVFLNPLWIEAFMLFFNEAEGKHFTRIAMHQGSACSQVDTDESPEDLAERIEALRFPTFETVADG